MKKLIFGLVLLLALAQSRKHQKKRHQTARRHKKQFEGDSIEIFGCLVYAPGQKAHQAFAEKAKEKGLELSDDFCLYMTVENAEQVLKEDRCIQLVGNMEKHQGGFKVVDRNLDIRAYNYNDFEDSEILDYVIQNVQSFKETQKGSSSLAVRALTVNDCKDGMVGDIKISEIVFQQPVVTEMGNLDVMKKIAQMKSMGLKKKMQRARKVRKRSQ